MMNSNRWRSLPATDTPTKKPELLFYFGISYSACGKPS